MKKTEHEKTQDEIRHRNEVASSYNQRKPGSDVEAQEDYLESFPTETRHNLVDNPKGRSEK